MAVVVAVAESVVGAVAVALVEAVAVFLAIVLTVGGLRCFWCLLIFVSLDYTQLF